MVTYDLGAANNYYGAMHCGLAIVHQEFHVWLVQARLYRPVLPMIPHQQCQ